MTFFKKTYTSSDIDELREKPNYQKLAKLLKHKELPVAKMAEGALHQLIESDTETERRKAVNDYMGLVKKLEAAEQSRPDLNIEPIVRVFVTEYDRRIREAQAEQEEVDRLSELLTQVGVHHHHDSNVRSLKALLEPDEQIESASHEGQRGTTIVRHDFCLYTNKGLYFLRGLSNHSDWGTIQRFGYDCFKDIKEKGLLKNKYEISGEEDDAFSSTFFSEDPLLKQLAKYGTPQIKDTLRQLGLLDKYPVITEAKKTGAIKRVGGDCGDCGAHMSGVLIPNEIFREVFLGAVNKMDGWACTTCGALFCYRCKKSLSVGWGLTKDMWKNAHCTVCGESFGPEAMVMFAENYARVVGPESQLEDAEFAVVGA